MEIIHLLIDKGANVNAVDEYGHTALDSALETNKSEGKFEQAVLLRISCKIEKIQQNYHTNSFSSHDNTL